MGKYFKIYTELFEHVQSLSYEQQGKLFEMCFKYNMELDYESDDDTVNSMFRFIVPIFDHKNVSWLHTYNPSDRKSYSYSKWRLCVLRRDKFTCRGCGSKRNLHVHHIFSYDQHEDLRLNTFNGLTLCKKCHFKAHKKIIQG